MKTTIEELEAIRQEHDGILYPKDVVDFARNENTALHEHFNWDDSQAAEQYRIWQARKIIKVNVTVLEREEIRFNTYVSLKQDRYDQNDAGEFTGGYRSTIEVLSVPTLRKTLLQEAIEEHDLWEKKYQNIIELADIFAAARTVKQKTELLAQTKVSA